MPELNDTLAHVASWPAAWRISLILGLALATHMSVRGIHRLTLRVLSASAHRTHPKLRTIASLSDSALVFTLYFLAVGFLLMELDVPLKAYLASASIVGLAVGFGAQGLVQDVVTGLTLVFSDLLDLDDMVDVGGQVGKVERMGLRFVVIRNFLGAEVFIPNRSINSVVRYRRGYVRAYCDINMPGAGVPTRVAEERIRQCMRIAEKRFSAVFIRESIIAVEPDVGDGASRMRARCCIWPGQGAPLETQVRRDVIEAMRRLDPGYQDWMVSVSYEVESSHAGTERLAG